VRSLPGQRPAWRSRELQLTLLASVLVAIGLFQVHRAKSEGLGEIDAGLTAKRLLNLNTLGAREELTPALAPFFPNARERDTAAREIYYLTGTLSNVGGIAHKKLLTNDQFRQLKPLLVVRRPAQFQRAFYLWSGIFLGAFWLVHVFWSVRGFRGDLTQSTPTLVAALIRAPISPFLCKAFPAKYVKNPLLYKLRVEDQLEGRKWTDANIPIPYYRG